MSIATPNGIKRNFLLWAFIFHTAMSDLDVITQYATELWGTLMKHGRGDFYALSSSQQDLLQSAILRFSREGTWPSTWTSWIQADESDRNNYTPKYAKFFRHSTCLIEAVRSAFFQTETHTEVLRVICTSWDAVLHPQHGALTHVLRDLVNQLDTARRRPTARLPRIAPIVQRNRSKTVKRYMKRCLAWWMHVCHFRSVTDSAWSDLSLQQCQACITVLTRECLFPLLSHGLKNLVAKVLCLRDTWQVIMNTLLQRGILRVMDYTALSSFSSDFLPLFLAAWGFATELQACIPPSQPRNGPIRVLGIDFPLHMITRETLTLSSDAAFLAFPGTLKALVACGRKAGHAWTLALRPNLRDVPTVPVPLEIIESAHTMQQQHRQHALTSSDNTAERPIMLTSAWWEEYRRDMKAAQAMWELSSEHAHDSAERPRLPSPSLPRPESPAGAPLAIYRTMFDEDPGADISVDEDADTDAGVDVDATADADPDTGVGVNADADANADEGAAENLDADEDEVQWLQDARFWPPLEPLQTAGHAVLQTAPSSWAPLSMDDVTPLQDTRAGGTVTVMQSLAQLFVDPILLDIAPSCPVLVRLTNGQVSSAVYEKASITQWIHSERERNGGMTDPNRVVIRDPNHQGDIDHMHPHGCFFQPHVMWCTYKAVREWWNGRVSATHLSQATRGREITATNEDHASKRQRIQ